MPIPGAICKMGPWHTRWIVLALLVSLTSSVPALPSYDPDESRVEENEGVTDVCLEEGDILCDPVPALPSHETEPSRVEENKGVTDVCLEEGDILCNPVPSWPSYDPDESRVEENEGVTDVCLEEGDILCDPIPILFETAQKFRTGPMNKNRLWLRRIVPYVVDSDFRPKYKEAIVKSMKDIEKISCLKFKEKEPEDEDFIAIRQLKGCYSYVGRKGGEQNLSLVKGCFTPARGIIIHELLHALGVIHEQTRPDRDNYVTIVEDNIKPGKLHNFKKRPPHLADTLGLRYDYSSLMHYRKYAFALDPVIPTVIPHSPFAKIGQRKYISKLDAQKLNKLYKCDIKECPHPGFPLEGFIVGRDFSVGASVVYICAAGHTLFGDKHRFCRFDGEWTGRLPYCIAREIVDTCNFESGMCGWKKDHNDGKLSWKRIQGRKQRLHIGPFVDHTLKTSKGYFLLLESEGPPECGTAFPCHGVVLTPIFRPQGGQVCLRLAYQMSGDHMTGLEIRMRFLDTDDGDLSVWSAQGNRGPSWKVLSLALPASEPFQIVIEGRIGGGLSHMAIDDYSLKDCVGNEPLEITVPGVSEEEPAPLPVEFGCTFEEELCDFVNADDADFYWLLAKGPTSTFRSGPSVDHTLGTEDGHYIYTEASFPRKPGDTAKIISPAIEDPSVPHCLRFYYHMYGDTMGTLKVHVLHGSTEPLSPMWVVQGNRGDLWRKVQLTIPATTGNLQIAFEGIIGDGVRSDIALDDILLMTGSCPTDEMQKNP